MKTLFKSRSVGKQFFGNTAEGEVVDKELLEAYNSIRYTYNQPLIELAEDGYQEWDELYDLLDYSDWYDFRVCESVRLFHYPEDVYAEELEVT